MTERSIFLTALEKEAAERTAYLDAACGGDAELRRQVDALLAEHAGAGNFLEGRAVDEHAPKAPTRPLEQPGSVIGPYKLLQQIGEGGMGVVFMAEQQEPVRRKVALKIIKPGMDSRLVLARFEAERQALALMDHPHIAKVLDAGTTNQGRPYFVMELVKGVPITQYCDERRLTPKDRLELFVPVCQAIQHAHQKGIIHRDLKPSNLLVALYDGKPVPKVIDFGVAKAIGPQLTERTLFTEFGSVIGTLEYMSPEQAELNQLDIDTRSDIYGLGVLLYELLTGTTPLERKRLWESALLEALRMIREEEVPKPSTRLSKTSELPSIAANRGLEPNKLGGQVRGELDWIIMKCLEKDRNRRYETANNLATDLQRFLHDEPVQASPPSAWYRFRKFVKRHKTGMAAALVVTVAAVLAVTALTTSTVLIARALEAVTEAKKELGSALERERRESYFQRIALAHRELLDNNLLKAEELLDECPSDRRAWEWHYLKRLCHVEPVTVRADHRWFQPVALSPDGQRLATATEAKTVTIWNAQTGEELFALAGAAEVRCAAFRATDGSIVTGDMSGAVTVWDATTRQAIGAPGRHKAAVNDLAVSPDGRLVASASDDHTVKVWEATTGELVHDLRGHEGSVYSVAFSRDGRSVASGGYDATVKVWDAKSGKLVQTLLGHKGPVRGLAFSADGRQLASASLDGTLKIWETSTAQEARTLHGHNLFVTGVAFIDDGRRLASVSSDKSLKIWDATTGQVVLTLRGHTHELTGLAISADGRRLASVSPERKVRIWDASPLDAKAGQDSLTLRHTDKAWDLSFSPDGRRLASSSFGGTVRVWDPQTGREDSASALQIMGLFSVAFSPDGRRIASGSARIAEGQPSFLKVWDTATSQEILHPRPFNGVAFCVAFSPDKGRWIVTGGETADATVWDATTGHVAGNLRTPGPHVWGLAFSPDGRRLACLSMEGMVAIYDATRWGDKFSPEPILTFQAHKSSVRANPAFSPDGKRLVVPGDENTVNIWDVTTTDKPPAAALLTLRGHSAQVWGVAFSPDGRWVASGGEDYTAKLWRAATGELIHSFRGHASVVGRVAFSPDGKRLASSSFDKTVKVWELSRWVDIPNR
jgi:WD40 repeat protein/serine/threonine protein kinase